MNELTQGILKEQMEQRLKYLESLYKLLYTSEGKSAALNKGCYADWETLCKNTEAEINGLRGMLNSKKGRASNGR